jgi:hypothetical protein
MAGAELASALSVALDEVVATKLREREKDSRAAELEVQLSDAQCAIEEMERGLRAREMDYDRRVVELQRRHSKKEAYLMRMTNAVTAQVDAQGESPVESSVDERDRGRRVREYYSRVWE